MEPTPQAARLMPGAQHDTFLSNALISLLAMNGKRSQAAAVFRDILARNPQNPYYRWVAGLEP
jgi:hypothetical protein